MIEYIVNGGSFSDRHEAKLRAAELASKSRKPVVVRVVVDSETSAWWYGGPAGLDKYRGHSWLDRVEIDSLTEHPPVRTLD